MARKKYSEEFRRDAVELYRSTPGATVSGIAEDLGIVRGRCRLVAGCRTGQKTAADGRQTSRCSPPRGQPPPEGETPEQELVRLRARVRELEDERRKLDTERDILRAAAKYFAGETNW